MAIVTIVIAISTLLLSFTSPITAQPPAASPAFVNVTDILSLDGPYHTFLDHLEDTQVIQTLQVQANNTQNQGITIFAPTDAAFASLKNPSLANLTKDQLRSLLLFHALPKYYTLTDLSKNVSGSTVTTLAGGQFSFNVTNSSGLIGIVTGLMSTNITSSVYSAVPVAVYQIDHVLVPETIYNVTATPSPSPSQRAFTPKGQ